MIKKNLIPKNLIKSSPTPMYRVCYHCEHRRDCLDNSGFPNEKKLQRKANRLGGIWRPPNCPFNSENNKFWCIS